MLMNLLAAVLALCASASQPEKAGTLAVVVYDTTPCLPVSGAAVWLDDSPAPTWTQADGVVRVERVPEREHTVRVESRGCRTSARVAVRGGAVTVHPVDIRSCRRP